MEVVSMVKTLVYVTMVEPTQRSPLNNESYPNGIGVDVFNDQPLTTV